MADDILISEGTAKSIAADDVSSVYFQKVKIDIGADGVSSPYTGTTNELTNLVAGTITKVEGGTIDVIADGTVVVGTVPGIGVLALGTVKVTEGSAVVKAGTITTILAGTQELLGTVANLAKGTLTAITAGTITQKAGTVTTILAGTQELLGTVGNLAKGTITSVANVAGGTVQINPKGGGSSVITYGTQITGAAQTWATVSSVSGAGTYHYIQGCSIVVKSGTVDTFLGFGSALSGTNVIAKGNFSEGGGGIARTFPSPLAGSGTNTELIVEIGGAGTVDFTVDFWRGT